MIQAQGPLDESIAVVQSFWKKVRNYGGTQPARKKKRRKFQTEETEKIPVPTRSENIPIPKNQNAEPHENADWVYSVQQPVQTEPVDHDYSVRGDTQFYYEP